MVHHPVQAYQISADVDAVAVDTSGLSAAVGLVSVDSYCHCHLCQTMFVGCFLVAASKHWHTSHYPLKYTECNPDTIHLKFSLSFANLLIC